MSIHKRTAQSGSVTWVVRFRDPIPRERTFRRKADAERFELRFRREMETGEYLDPVADKLLLSTLFLVFTHKDLIPARVTALVFGRDVGILLVSAILYAAAGRREFIPSIFGKANTCAQISAVAFVLLHQMNPAIWIMATRTFALNATMVLTVASGLHYAWAVSRRVGLPAAAAAEKSDINRRPA